MDENFFGLLLVVASLLSKVETIVVESVTVEIVDPSDPSSLVLDNLGEGF